MQGLQDSVHPLVTHMALELEATAPDVVDGALELVMCSTGKTNLRTYRTFNSLGVQVV